MVNAKAMVAVAARAVPELKIRIFGIGSAANGAFMTIMLISDIAFDLLGSLLKIDHLR